MTYTTPYDKLKGVRMVYIVVYYTQSYKILWITNIDEVIKRG